MTTYKRFRMPITIEFSLPEADNNEVAWLQKLDHIANGLHDRYKGLVLKTGAIRNACPEEVDHPIPEELEG